MNRRSSAWLGTARHGFGMGAYGATEENGRTGAAWRGVARRGAAGLGSARHGMGLAWAPMAHFMKG